MIKDVRYTGMSEHPSDYSCKDGDLSMALNLINEDGDIKPLGQPKNIGSIGYGERLFIHKILGGANHIAYSPYSGSFRWFATKGGNGIEMLTDPQWIDTEVSEILSVEAIGNIIVMTSVSGSAYIRFNTESQRYDILGSSIPKIRLDFSLKLNFESTESRDKTLVFKKRGDVEYENGEEYEDGYTAVSNTEYDFKEPRRFFRPIMGPVNAGDWITSSVNLNSDITLRPENQYKLVFHCNWTCPHNPKSDDNIPGSIDHLRKLTLNLYGCREKSNTPELVCSISKSTLSQTPFDQTQILNTRDTWTKLYFSIKFADCCGYVYDRSVSGYLSISAKGIGSADVEEYIEYSQDSYNALMGAINKFSSEATSRSTFIHPFFVRYAVRLYDGSCAYVSDPALMIPNSDYVPIISYKNEGEAGGRLILSAFAASLQYKSISKLPDVWKDLVTDIDIYVSAPIYPYDQGKEYDLSQNRFVHLPSVSSKGWGSLHIDALGIEVDEGRREIHELSDVVCKYLSQSNSLYVQVSPHTTEEIKKRLISISNYYKISTIRISDMKESDVFTDVDIEKDSLKSLQARETMPQDVLAYSGFAGGYTKVYNNRLHLFATAPLLGLPSCSNLSTILDNIEDSYFITKVWVYVRTDQGVKITATTVSGKLAISSWYFYPDPRAFKAIFMMRSTDGTDTRVWEIELTRHPLLNGACWVNLPFKALEYEGMSKVDNFTEPSIASSIPAPTSIYVSEPSNPFVFKAGSVVSVSASRVMALSTAAKALSQGQFGQFPLYAFTDEGVWAISVSDTGTYSARQPITRDVCINPAGITQIDSAVLFPSDRGIMLLSGSEVTCISDVINTDTPFNVAGLKGMDRIHDYLGHQDLYTCLQLKPFSEFLKKAGMIYDYSHQRIIVYNPNISYAYVWSLKSRLWSLMESHIKNSVNSYPEALALAEDSNDRHHTHLNMVDLSQSSDRLVPGLLVTRPLKLDAPDVHKTVSTVIQRGVFERGHVQSVLYGSRDMVNWFAVWSSANHIMTGFYGSPYKYFRVALLTTMHDGESVSGGSFDFTPRITNKLR